jgi:hypothetical protein
MGWVRAGSEGGVGWTCRMIAVAAVGGVGTCRYVLACVVAQGRSDECSFAVAVLWVG